MASIACAAIARKNTSLVIHIDRKTNRDIALRRNTIPMSGRKAAQKSEVIPQTLNSHV
jgi:hypothetical protein